MSRWISAEEIVARIKARAERIKPRAKKRKPPKPATSPKPPSLKPSLSPSPKPLYPVSLAALPDGLRAAIQISLPEVPRWHPKPKPRTVSPISKSAYRNLLYRLIDDMTPTRRSVLTLLYIDPESPDLYPSEVSRRIGISRQTVSQRHKQALQELADTLPRPRFPAPRETFYHQMLDAYLETL